MLYPPSRAENASKTPVSSAPDLVFFLVGAVREPVSCRKHQGVQCLKIWNKSHRAPIASMIDSHDVVYGGKIQ